MHPERLYSNREQRTVILAVTIGSILEWYEVFLYVFWAPTLAGLFFDKGVPFVSLFNTLLIFGVGFFARPLGGVIFGHIGDRFGRRTSFILSIVAISVPSLIIGILPDYSTWGNLATLSLGVMKFIQGIPAGGELPGAMCYLSEMATHKNRRYLSSYAFVGAQIGGILGMVESILLEDFVSQSVLNSWGWRASFIISGLLGLLGVFLRKKLHETPLFAHLEEKHKIVRTPVLEVIKHFKKKIVKGFFVSIFEVVGYFMIALFPAIYFDRIIGISRSTNFMISIAFLTLSAITIPIFGHWGDRSRPRRLLILSGVGSLLLCIPFYFAVMAESLVFFLVIQVTFIFFLNIQFALLPSLLASLFPTTVRFTGLGLSFNLCDSIIGGLTPAIALYVVHRTENPGSFILLLAGAAVVFLFSLPFVREKHALE